jgi:hypothetical protein
MNPRRIAAFSFALVALGVSSVPAQYSATVLPVPTGDVSGEVYAGSEGQLVGSAAYSYPAAMIWNQAVGSPINLNRWRFGSAAYAAYQGTQGGAAFVTSYTTSGSGKGGGGSRTYFIPHAVTWQGSAISAVDLNPTGMYESVVNGIWGVQEVGWASTALFASPHAQLWKGASPAAIDLNPAGFSGSEAVGVQAGYQVGYGSAPNYATHALMWKGSAASVVDLHPTKFNAYQSYAYAIDATLQIQAGVVDLGVSGASLYHACLWKGTPGSAIDLNPAGFINSQAVATAGGFEAGFGTTSAWRVHALVWQGSPTKALDLQTFLPSTYVSSEALGVDSDGSIVGYASDGRNHYPVIWRPSAHAYLAITQSVSNEADGWSNEPVSVTIASPFATTGRSISYRISGGDFKTSAGGTVSLPFAITGTSILEAYASDGKGQTTPWQLYTVNVDMTAPVTSVEYANFILALTAKDQGSGVAVTYFSLDGGTTAAYSGPIPLTNVSHSLKYWSVDYAGNTETPQERTIAAVSPTLTSISPASVLSGGQGFTLDLTGSGFLSNSVVMWNGTPIPTSYQSATKLEATVSATEIATAGTADIAVTNPSPGTGTSKSQTLTILQRATAVGVANQEDGAGLSLKPLTSYSGFTPTCRSVNVSTSAATTFLDASGNPLTESQFYDQLQDSQSVKAVGTYTSASNTLAAVTLQLQ